MKSRLSLLFAVVGLVAAAWPGLAQSVQTAQPQTLRVVDLKIGRATLHAQIAATGDEREIGLMYVSKMSDNDGMIFLMPAVSQATFWMKNTLIPLSVAFIDPNGVILDIHDMQPGDPTLPDANLPVTRSDTDRTAYALETNLHWFALNGIKPGDKILPPPSTLGKPQP
jgi:uncharacterized membrane protein (UPF0127 family)